jgi:hypothetical protein
MTNHLTPEIARAMRAIPRRPVARVCQRCGAEFQHVNPQTKWCSFACRQKAYRERHQEKE